MSKAGDLLLLVEELTDQVQRYQVFDQASNTVVATGSYIDMVNFLTNAMNPNYVVTDNVGKIKAPEPPLFSSTPEQPQTYQSTTSTPWI